MTLRVQLPVAGMPPQPFRPCQSYLRPSPVLGPSPYHPHARNPRPPHPRPPLANALGCPLQAPGPSLPDSSARDCLDRGSYAAGVSMEFATGPRADLSLGAPYGYVSLRRTMAHTRREEDLTSYPSAQFALHYNLEAKQSAVWNGRVADADKAS
ncbi:hypothetical protein BD309DRAFT_971801 [Dichomitus squalens]|uniref:Uncharacterized protein n=1 Tax=Dichomitus squalens TaxID=114155 RepID=A0A4Q9PLI6_9APHY|nr:hypothetical protein BD309DRAFT_971801 [Dichomitus squalens]TBU55031.1 hypothetical protein BD310DRAFT_934508 [Dichomitus squalens]